MSPVDTFEHLILCGSAQELVPFLLQLSTPEEIAVRQKTKRLKRTLEAIQPLGSNSWGSVITEEQRFMLLLAALKTYTKKEAFSTGFDHVTMPAVGTWEYTSFWLILEQARPAWLLDLLLARAADKNWATPDYALVRELESRQFFAHHPALSAASLPSRLRAMGSELSVQTPVPSRAADVLADQLGNDVLLVERDLYLLFDFDTPVDSAGAYVQAPRPVSQHTSWTSKSWQAWNKVHPAQQISWVDMFTRLVSASQLSREQVLTRSLVAMQRDFRRPLLTWYKNLLLALQPTLDERLARQQELVALLAHPQAQVVNFALDQLKDLWGADAFDPAPLLLYADGLLTRQDLKTGQRMLLSGFDKLTRCHPSLTPELGRLTVTALSSADAAVQERAAKLLVGLLTAKDPLLTQTAAADLSASLPEYADFLTSAARNLLAPWLGVPADLAQDSAKSRYIPAQAYVPELSAQTEIMPVADWHELLFLTGPVLQHKSPALRERWIEGLLRLRPHFPAEYSAQLLPYVLQVLPNLKDQSAADTLDVLHGPITITAYDGLVQALLLSWATGFAIPRVTTVVPTTDYHHADPLVNLDQQRLAHAEHQLRQPSPLPLLSTPTHTPYWVAPTALVHRLLAYQAAEQEPNAADLAIALARTAHAHPSNAEQARSQVAALQDEQLRGLLLWFLGAKDQSLPMPLEASVAASGDEQLVRKANTEPWLQAALPWLWGVAARTKHPAGVFTAVAAWPAGAYPGIDHPWQPDWSVEAKTGAHGFAATWTELCFAVKEPERPVPSGLLLYSQHAAFKRGGRYSVWSHTQPLSVDYPFLASLIPNNPSPLHWHVVHSAAWVDKLEAAERDIVHQALQALLLPGPTYDEAATLVLASGLTHHAAVCRAVALEALLSAVAAHRIVPTVLGRILGKLLGAGYAPVLRLADVLTQLLGIEAIMDDALQQIMQALLLELPLEEPVRNTRKLLEAYANVASRTRQPLPATLQAHLHAWRRSASLRKVVAHLL